MTEFKLVPVEPTEEMATAAMNAEIHANRVYGEAAAFSDIWRAMLDAAPAAQGEPVFMWHRGAADDESEVVDVDCACPCCVPLYTAPQPAGAALPPEITREMLGMIIDEVFGGGIEDASVIEDIYRVIARSATPQPAEQKQPYRQSPPDDPLGGLEHRADGEANFYTLSSPTGRWVARIQFNGELRVHEQERILSAMLGDRNVRYGDGYHQGYWDARQDSPDVSELVDALELARDRIESERRSGEWDPLLRDIDAALAAYRQGGDV